MEWRHLSDKEILNYAEEYIKKNKIESRKNLERRFSGLYQILAKRKLSYGLSIKRKHRNWQSMKNNEVIKYTKKVIEENELKSRNDVKHFDFGLYRILNKRKIIGFIPPKLTEWHIMSNEELVKRALSLVKKKSLKRRIDIENESPVLYSYLRKRNLMDRVLPLYFTDYSKFSDKKLISEAKEYIKENKITQRHQLNRLSIGLYKHLKKRGFLDELLPSLRKEWEHISDDELIDYSKDFIKRNKIGTTTELLKKNSKLHAQIYARRINKEVLPSGRRNWSEIYDYEVMKMAKKLVKKYKIRFRSHLNDIDSGVYNQLLKRELMDAMFPYKRGGFWRKFGFVGRKKPSKSWFRNTYNR